MDGSFGMTAAVAEMLLQSHEGFIDFLPALPSAWETGRVSGLVARGNFEVSLAWEKGKLKQTELLSILNEKPKRTPFSTPVLEIELTTCLLYTSPSPRD